MTNPESLELLEQEIRQLTNKLGSLLLEEQVQNSLLSYEFQEQEKELIKSLPSLLKSEGREQVNIQTSLGFMIVLSTCYIQSNCDRKKGKRYAGVYAGLTLLRIHNRGTKQLVSEIG